MTDDRYPLAAWLVALAIGLAALVTVGVLFLVLNPPSSSPPTTVSRYQPWALAQEKPTTTTYISGPVSTTTTQAAPTATTMAATTTLPPPPTAIPVRVWRPADECQRLRVSVSPAVLRFCPYTAQALYEGQRRGKWTWDPGELSRYMALFSCESRGNPSAKNPHSTASGLGQFLNGTWTRWAPRAAEFFGFDNPDVFAAYDNILTTIYLSQVDDWNHWRCWRRYE